MIHMVHSTRCFPSIHTRMVPFFSSSGPFSMKESHPNPLLYSSHHDISYPTSDPLPSSLLMPSFLVINSLFLDVASFLDLPVIPFLSKWYGHALLLDTLYPSPLMYHSNIPPLASSCCLSWKKFSITENTRLLYWDNRIQRWYNVHRCLRGNQ